MDYHPEIEARMLERRGFGAIARLVRRIDASAMRRFATVITLDRAMARMVRDRARGVEVLEHPTWGSEGATSLSPVSYRPGGGTGPVRLAYSGNLGTAHDPELFGAFLGELMRRRKVEIFVIGASPAGNDRFLRLGEALDIPIVTHGRVPFSRLRELYNDWRIDAGVVLLADDSAGLLSPSKFSGYINFGVPLLYIGPADTNTADVCTRFDGGFCLSNCASREEMGSIADALLDPDRMAKMAEGARAAAEHFSHLNHLSLAALLAPRLKGLGPI